MGFIQCTETCYLQLEQAKIHYVPDGKKGNNGTYQNIIIIFAKVYKMAKNRCLVVEKNSDLRKKNEKSNKGYHKGYKEISNRFKFRMPKPDQNHQKIQSKYSI